MATILAESMMSAAANGTQATELGIANRAAGLVTRCLLVSTPCQILTTLLLAAVVYDQRRPNDQSVSSSGGSTNIVTSHVPMEKRPDRWAFFQDSLYGHVHRRYLPQIRQVSSSMGERASELRFGLPSVRIPCVDVGQILNPNPYIS